MVKSDKKLVVACYLAAIIVWLGLCTVHVARNALARRAGTLVQQTLTAQQTECVGFENCADTGRIGAPDDDPDWYISTDSDPHILWQGEAYLESVTFEAEYARPAGSIVLYYLRPGQTDYSESQKVFAVQKAPGEYVFSLGGKTVTGLRIDPDSRGGVTVCWRGITLNDDTAVSLWPDARAWLFLLVMPAAAAAVFKILLSLAQGANKANNKSK